MEAMKKLPDAEFEIMKVVWANDPPITTGVVKQQLGDQRKWRAQTINSLMLRLVERGFLRTEKTGKERSYFPLIEKEAYLKFETNHFMKQYHDSSVLNLVNTLYGDRGLTDADLEELMAWMKERRG